MCVVVFVQLCICVCVCDFIAHWGSCCMRGGSGVCVCVGFAMVCILGKAVVFGAAGISMWTTQARFLSGCVRSQRGMESSRRTLVM